MIKQVLLISSNRTVSRYFKEAMKKKLSVIPLENTQDGLSWLNLGNFPDLILIDSIEKELETLEFIMQIRKRAVNDIPVIIIAEQTQKLDINMLSMVEGFLFKPFSTEKLQKVILNTISPKYQLDQMDFNTPRLYPSLLAN